MEIENELVNSKPVLDEVKEPENEEMNITLKSVDSPSQFAPSYDDINPIDLSIDETLKMRADDRRKKVSGICFCQ